MQGSIFLLLFIGACFQPLQGIDFELNILEYSYDAEGTFEPNTHKGSMRINNVGEEECRALETTLIDERDKNEDPRNNNLYTFMTAKEEGTENYRGVYGVTEIRCEEKSEGEEIHHSISFQFSWMGRADGQPHVYALFIDGQKEFLCFVSVDLTNRSLDVRKEYPGIWRRRWSVLFSTNPIKVLHALQKRIEESANVESNQLVLGGPLRENGENLLPDQLQRHYIIFSSRNIQGKYLSVKGEPHLTYSFEKLESYMPMFSVKVDGEEREIDGLFYAKGEDQRIVISQAYYFTTKEFLEETRDTLEGLQVEKRDAPFVSVSGPWKTRPNEESDEIKVDVIWMSLPNLYDVEVGEDADGYATLTLTFSPRPKLYKLKMEGENSYSDFIGYGFVSSKKGYLVFYSNALLFVAQRDAYLNRLKRSLQKVDRKESVGSIRGPLTKAGDLPWMPIDELTWKVESFRKHKIVFSGLVLSFSIPPSEGWDNLYVVAFGSLIFAGTFDRDSGHLIIWADLPPATSYTHSRVALTDAILNGKSCAIDKATGEVPFTRVSGPLSRWPESLHSLQWARVTVTTMTEIRVEGEIARVDCEWSHSLSLDKQEKFAARIHGLQRSFPVEVDKERREIIIREFYSDGDLNPLSLDFLKKELVLKAKEAYKNIGVLQAEKNFLLLSEEPMTDVSKFIGDSRRSIFGVARIEEFEDNFGVPSLKFRYSSETKNNDMIMGFASFRGKHFLVLGVLNEYDNTLEFEVRMKYCDGSTLDKQIKELKTLALQLDPTIQKSTSPAPSSGQSSEGRRVESEPIDSHVEAGSSSGPRRTSKMRSPDAGSALKEQPTPPPNFYIEGPFTCARKQAFVQKLHDEQGVERNRWEMREYKRERLMVVTKVKYTDDDVPLLTIEHRIVNQ